MLSTVLSVFLDSRALRRGGGDEGSEEEVTEMTGEARRIGRMNAEREGV